MKTLINLVSGVVVGAVFGLWLGYGPMPPPHLPAVREAALKEQKNAHPGTTGPQPPALPTRSLPLRVSVSEILHTGEAREAGADDAIQGNLPKNLRFRWMEDPASGLAPAFLWERNGEYRLGAERIAPQDGDIRRAYAFEAPAVLPDQYEGRLIFHRKLLNRLLEWSHSLPVEPGPEALVVSVEKVDASTVRLHLPAHSGQPSTYLTVTL